MQGSQISSGSGETPETSPTPPESSPGRPDPSTRGTPNRQVLVAGGTGFVGRHVTTALRAAGHHVRVLARGTRGGAETETDLIRCNVALREPPLEALQGCDAIVNLVGTLREAGAQNFESGHVGATSHLIAAAKALGIRRFVQISVVGIRPLPHSPYHTTKARAEEHVRASGLEFTILKPGVIFGPSDPMVTRLIQAMPFLPVFPLVGRADAPMRPVHVRDVARAVVAALERDVSAGKSYDVVGPNRITWREVVLTVAVGTGRRTRLVSTPLALQRIGVALMERLLRRPLLTSWQLQMLIDGLDGDPAPMAADLGVAPEPFTAEAVREIAVATPPLFRRISRR